MFAKAWYQFPYIVIQLDEFGTKNEETGTKTKTWL